MVLRFAVTGKSFNRTTVHELPAEVTRKLRVHVSSEIIRQAEESLEPINLRHQRRSVQPRSTQDLLAAYLKFNLVVHKRVPLADEVLQRLVQGTALRQVVSRMECLWT